RDRSAPVAALRHVAPVVQTLHQLRPGAGDTVGIPAGDGRPAREPVTGQRGDDDVESVLRAATVRGWIRKRAYGLELLDDGSRPTVRDDQRQRIRMARAQMDEVNVHPVDGRNELRKGVEPRFYLSPVVAGAPVPDECLELV